MLDKVARKAPEVCPNLRNRCAGRATAEQQNAPSLTKSLGEANKKGEPEVRLSLDLAEWTGLEPATPGVTGRYSNQLNYHS